MVGKTSSEESIKDETLDEAEEIGKDLEGRKFSHDADDIFLLNQLMNDEPDLVPRKPVDYYDLFFKWKKKTPGYTSHRQVAESAGLESHGTVGRQFRRIEDAILKLRSDSGTTPAEEIPAMDAVRIAEILKKGKLVQLDPHALLPPEDHPHYKLSRYFQKRRAPRGFDVDLPILAANIAEIGMIEPPTIQEASSDNGFNRRVIDGFGRIAAWILAETLGAESKNDSALNYPVCLVIDCTNAEGDLIALEKNQNKENFDEGDKDYSIVTMYERHKEVYPQKRLAKLFGVSFKRISNIITSWQDSYPWDEKKGETQLDNLIRRALEKREITTYHGEQLARLQKWPSEQKRIANWLLEEVTKYTRRDAYLEEQWNRDEVRGEFKSFKMNPEGVSAGHLKVMVSKSVENMEHAEAIEKISLKRLKDGKLESKITPEQFDKIRAEISKERTRHEGGIPKSYVEKGLKAAGIRIVTPKPDVDALKPVSPATSAKKAVKEEPVLVCNNCQAYYMERNSNSDELDSCCMIGIEPTEENECAIQAIFPGTPNYRYYKCLYCGGVTLTKFLEDLPVQTEYEKSEDGWVFEAHDLCVMDRKLKNLDIKGKCQFCVQPACELLEIVERGKMDITVNHCPDETEHETWFTQRPEIIIEDVNTEVQKRIDQFVSDARKQFEKPKAAGRSA